MNRPTWLVTLTKTNDLIAAEYGPGYFPRRLFTKSEAYGIARLIEALGGQARVDKEVSDRRNKGLLP